MVGNNILIILTNTEKIRKKLSKTGKYQIIIGEVKDGRFDKKN